jgi:hypothetical protein
LLYEHGIAVGDMVEPITVPCSDSTQRVVADTTSLQLVTITSVDDYCAECHRHLLGLDAVARLTQLGDTGFFLTYAPPARQAEIVKAYRAKTSQPVCFDQVGAMWEKYNLRHTPVTLLLLRGRVVYAHDTPLDDSTSRADMVAAISWFRAG